MALAALRVSSNIVTTLFTMGSVLLLFFIVLAGSKPSGVLQKWYFLSADTSDIDGCPYPVSRWSMYGVCGYQGSPSDLGDFINCTSNKADYPFDLVRNFGDNVPDTFKQHSHALYYETRFQFPFYLIALTCQVAVLFITVFAGKVRSIAHAGGGLNVGTALFIIPAASLTTAAYVRGRNLFHQENREAKLGPALLGFAWAVVFMVLYNSIVFFFNGPAKSESGGSKFASPSNNGKGRFSGGYKFGIGSKKTTEGPAKGETSSFVRA